MKNNITILLLSALFISSFSNTAFSQKWLNKLEKRVDRKINQKERQTERKIERKIDNKIDRSIDQLLSGKWLKKKRSTSYPDVKKVQDSKAGKDIVKIEQNIEDFYINYEKGDIDASAKNIDKVNDHLLKAKSKDSEYDYTEYEKEVEKMNGILFGVEEETSEPEVDTEEVEAED